MTARRDDYRRRNDYRRRMWRLVAMTIAGGSPGGPPSHVSFPPSVILSNTLLGLATYCLHCGLSKFFEMLEKLF